MAVLFARRRFPAFDPLNKLNHSFGRDRVCSMIDSTFEKSLTKFSFFGSTRHTGIMEVEVTKPEAQESAGKVAQRIRRLHIARI